MNNNIIKAIQKVKKNDPDFLVDSVWQTKDEIVLVSDIIGVPPYIVNKSDHSVRQVVFGDKRDMDIAYKKSLFVSKWRRSDGNDRRK